MLAPTSSSGLVVFAVLVLVQLLIHSDGALVTGVIVTDAFGLFKPALIQSDDAARERRQVKSLTKIPAKSKHLSGKRYQECVALGSQPGHCRHIASCKAEIYRISFPQLVPYMCVIENQFIGICCPNDVAAEGNDKRNPISLGGLAGELPAIASEDPRPDGDDDNDEVTGERSSRAGRGCGVSSRDQSRVTGGQPTKTRDWPWIAALLHGRKQYCGGVLITDRHVLTAAHCVHRYKPRELAVRLGEYDLSLPNETRHIDLKVSEIRIHGGYVASTYRHDIAILKLSRPTIFNTYIWPICLPPLGATFENKPATVIGWGTTSFGGASSYILMEVNVPIWPREQCATRFVQEITSNNICAGAYEGNGDACQGDSGGPLLHQLDNGRWVSVGVVSWGIGCGQPNRPGIYTRVSAYLDWIFANTVF